MTAGTNLCYRLPTMPLMAKMLNSQNPQTTSYISISASLEIGCRVDWPRIVVLIQGRSLQILVSDHSDALCCRVDLRKDCDH